MDAKRGKTIDVMNGGSYQKAEKQICRIATSTMVSHRRRGILTKIHEGQPQPNTW